jgi:DNA-binding IclR family transcriptional regulator
MGKALLAFASAETVDEVLENGLEQFTPFTIVAVPTLRRALAVARMTRVATTRQELRLNTAAVAVPVVAGGGAVVAALELTTGGPGYQLHLLQSAVVVAARALSRELTASQHRRWPGPVAALTGCTVTTLRPGAMGVGAAQDNPVGRSVS